MRVEQTSNRSVPAEAALFIAERLPKRIRDLEARGFAKAQPARSLRAIRLKFQDWLFPAAGSYDDAFAFQCFLRNAGKVGLGPQLLS